MKQRLRKQKVGGDTQHKKCYLICIWPYLTLNEGYLAIPSKYNKLIVSLRTCYSKEYSLDKEQTSYNDSLDALRLALKGYNIK